MAYSIPNGYRAKNYKWLVFGSISIGLFVSVMDQTALTLAIPSIAENFTASIPTVQWVILGYILTITSFMLPMGRLADMVGRKHICTLGLALFTIGAALAGSASSLGVLIAMKMIQGVGSSMVQATSMAIVTSTFPVKERGKAIGLLTTIVGLGAIAGPVVGGTVITTLGWRYIFLMAIPIGIVSVIAALIILRNDRTSHSADHLSVKGFDLLGTGLSSLGLIGLLLIMSFGNQIGWTSPIVIAGIIGSLITVVLFILWESRVSQPLIPLELFQKNDFVYGTSANLLSFMASTSIFFLMPFYLQEILNYSPSHSGLILVSTALCMTLIGPLSGRLSDRFGTRPFMLGGLLLSTVAFLLMSHLDATSSIEFVLVTLIIAGIGMATFFSPNASFVFGTVERNQYGMTAALLNLIRNAGNIIGIAITTTIVAYSMSSQGFEPSLSELALQEGGGARTAFTSGLNTAFLISALFSGSAFLLCLKRAR